MGYQGHIEQRKTRLSEVGSLWKNHQIIIPLDVEWLLKEYEACLEMCNASLILKDASEKYIEELKVDGFNKDIRIHELSQ